MADSKGSLTRTAVIEAAVASLGKLSLVALNDVAIDDLVALATLCARWQHAIGEELVRRHKERPGGR
jgi:hypothetical protein